jgi:cell division protein FtsN
MSKAGIKSIRLEIPEILANKIELVGKAEFRDLKGQVMKILSDYAESYNIDYAESIGLKEARTLTQKQLQLKSELEPEQEEQPEQAEEDNEPEIEEELIHSAPEKAEEKPKKQSSKSFEDLESSKKLPVKEKLEVKGLTV